MKNIVFLVLMSCLLIGSSCSKKEAYVLDTQYQIEKNSNNVLPFQTLAKNTTGSHFYTGDVLVIINTLQEWDDLMYEMDNQPNVSGIDEAYFEENTVVAVLMQDYGFEIEVNKIQLINSELKVTATQTVITKKCGSIFQNPYHFVTIPKTEPITTSLNLVSVPGKC
jgi:hypothetical protein